MGARSARQPLRALLAVLCLGVAATGLWQAGRAAAMPVKAVAAQWLLQRAFDASLADGRPHKPWPWADMTPAARLRVPRLGVQRIVLDTGSGQAMAFGPTLLPGGARLGEPGTAVIAAHRDTHFRFLADLRTGDEIRLQQRSGVTRRYRVARTAVVAWNAFAIPDAPGGRYLALATCYPFHAEARGPLRYVVYAVADDVVRPQARQSS